MNPPGYSIKTIELSDDLQAEHHLEAVHVQALRQRGDGWVLNEWQNRQLSGSVIQLHRQDTEYGRTYYYDYPTIDSALLEVDKVYDTAMVAATRIMGPETGPTPTEQGELPELRDVRIQLGHWVMLSQAEREDIEAYFGRVYDPRQRAIHPLNIAIAAKAARMQQLQEEKNPGATLAMSHPLERAFEGSYLHIVRDVIGVRNQRKQRLLLHSFEESRQLASANSILDDLITNQKVDDFYRLHGVASHLRFRHEPFNLLAFSLRGTHGMPEDVSVFEIAQRGIRFERLRNYYLEPFRKLGSMTVERLGESMDAAIEKYVPAIEQRIEGLESAEIGGQYDTHTDLLSQEAQRVQSALYLRDPALAKARIKAFKTRIERHGDPANPAELEPWFRYQFAIQSRR